MESKWQLCAIPIFYFADFYLIILHFFYLCIEKHCKTKTT